MKGIIKNILFCSFFVSMLGCIAIKGATDNQIQERVQWIFKDAKQLVTTAQDRFDKFSNGSYQKDHLTFKDFVLSLDGLSSGLEQNVLSPLVALNSEIKNDPGLSKALSIVQSVTTKIVTGFKKLYKELLPYKTKNDTNNAYKIANIIISNVKGFLDKECLNRYKSYLDEVVSILTKKIGYSTLAQELREFQKALGNLTFDNSNVTQAHALRLIINRIRYNKK